jgi:membrane associated rhomboid family serine protease
MFPIGDHNEAGRGPAIWTLTFLAINAVVFLVFQLGHDEFTYAYSAVPLEITTGRDLIGAVPVSTPDGGRILIPQEDGPDPIQLTLLTSMFMHGGWLHLLGNLLFLWIFGDNVEHLMGRVLYPLFYLGAGVVASFAQILSDPDSVIPTLGASGAISGVLGAYLVLFPGNRVTVFVFRFVTYVPAVVAIGMWAVLQFVNGFGSLTASSETGGVAYLAHIGGFVAGVVVALVLRALGFGAGRGPRRSYAR